MTLLFLFLTSFFCAFADDEVTIESIIGANKTMNRQLSGSLVGTGETGDQCPSSLKTAASSEKSTQVFEMDGQTNKVEMSILTPEEAQRHYEEIVRPKSSTMRLRNARVCQDRAHMIALGFNEKNIRTAKLFVQPRLGYVSINSEAAAPFFEGVKFHVSNMILVKNSQGKTEPWVIDPFVFPKGPVPKSEYDKVFSSGIRQAIYLAPEYAYDSGDIFNGMTKYDSNHQAIASSNLETAYSTRGNPSYLMSPDRRERYLIERDAEMRGNP